MGTIIRISREIKNILDVKKKELNLNNYSDLMILMIESKSFCSLKNPFETRLNKVRVNEMKESGLDEKDNNTTS